MANQKRYRNPAELIEAELAKMRLPKSRKSDRPMGFFERIGWFLNQQSRPTDAKIDLSPRLSIPPMPSEAPQDKQTVGQFAIPEPPKPVEIPDKMWTAGLIGALIAPRHAGQFLSAPLLWQQREETKRQTEWQKQIDLLFKQLELAMKGEELNIRRLQAESDAVRAGAYAKSVEDLAPVRESQVDLNRARAMKAMSDTLMAQYKLSKDQADTLANLYLRAGDPRASLEERKVLLRLAEDYGRQLNPELFPETVRTMFPSLELPETPSEREITLSPAQERALADAKASEALAGLQAERTKTEQETREKKLALMDADLLIKAKTLEKIDADIAATKERLRLARESLALAQRRLALGERALNLRERQAELSTLRTYRSHWQTQANQLRRAIDQILNNPQEWTTITTTDARGQRTTQRVPRYSQAQQERLNELRRRLAEIEGDPTRGVVGILDEIDQTLDELLTIDLP